MSTPALSPRPRDSSHTTQSRSRPIPTPVPSRQNAARSPIVSNPPLLTPRHLNEMKTPAHSDAKAASPNYFGLQVDAKPDVFASSAAQHIRGNWSPPSSNVRSTAAISPRIIPVDKNPEFEQFRRQSENNQGFSLGTTFNFGPPPPLTAVPKGPVAGAVKKPSMAMPTSSNKSSNEPKEDGRKLMVKPRSPKRLLSSESAMFPERPRRNSPASFLDKEGYGRTNELAEFADDRSARSSLPPTNRAPHNISMANHRAETLPETTMNDGVSEGPNMVTPQHIVNILESSVDEVLLLDLRVSTQYAQARIAGALSLCIPTTLLKRSSFNVQKLAETFKEEESKQKFENWRRSKHIVVYDANSSQMKDAQICLNTLKKFSSEGWTGGSYIIRGGFQEFSQKFPSWVSQGSTPSSTSASSQMKMELGLPAVAPVIGGCPMPVTQNAANPFFGNIRQNMDLIGGVGQMPIKQPASTTQSFEKELPQWLQDVSNVKDNGKQVSDKFLYIEKREQKRMQEALSGKVVYGTPTRAGPQPQTPKRIQIAGIEKGSKNRYNSIWPYEHSRVKLQGVSSGGCDYFNANHVQSTFSNKRYIATQGPLPATFNDFWNVVWQQDVRVIVMLTAESEGGQLKAHNYWSGNQYGPLHLNVLGEHRASLEPSKIHKNREQWRPTLVQRRSTNPPSSAYFPEKEEAPSPSSEAPHVIVRKFTLANSDQPFERMREITQLQYSHWPDFGAPAHPTHLLGLIEQCDDVCRQVNGGSSSHPDPPNVRPILVHCSAGCGRTGTFCTVDSVIDMLKRQRQAHNVRQSTPMEMSSFDKEPQGSPMHIDKKEMGRKDLSSNSKSHVESEAEKVVEEGSWTTREDIDLIAKTVEDFRLQRLSMVQSLRQFVLCYESVLEWLVEQYPKSA